MKNFLIVVLVGVVLSVASCGDQQSLGEDGGPDNQNQTQPVCGNGVLETGEQCDDGSQNSDTAPNACRTTCRTPYCGDGVIDQGEACDGSNLVGNACTTFGFTKGALGCTADTCQFDTSGCSLCGNNQAEGQDDSQVHYEVCDGTDLRGQDCISIGQAQGTLACQPLTCTWDISGCVGVAAICGNDILEQGEECDDGNQDNCDGCSAVCRTEQCGNGQVDCGEECDDGNQDDTDACTTACLSAECGDGIVQQGEECDDGNTDNCDGCSNACQLNTCGNLLVECDEQCDRGGEAADCDRDCTVPVCGDGIVNVAAGEQCDDGNVTPGDGCSATCQVESGWYCTGEPSVCETECGDGVVAGTEQCDDGDVDDLDGCSSACQVEANWDCMGQPSYCDQVQWIGDPCTSAANCSGLPLSWQGVSRACGLPPSFWMNYNTPDGYCTYWAVKCVPDCPQTDPSIYDAMTSCPVGSVMLVDFIYDAGSQTTIYIKSCAKACTAAGQGQCRENPDPLAPDNYACIDKDGVMFCYNPESLSPNYTATQF